MGGPLRLSINSICQRMKQIDFRLFWTSRGSPPWFYILVPPTLVWSDGRVSWRDYTCRCENRPGRRARRLPLPYCKPSGSPQISKADEQTVVPYRASFLSYISFHATPCPKYLLLNNEGKITRNGPFSPLHSPILVMAPPILNPAASIGLMDPYSLMRYHIVVYDQNHQFCMENSLQLSYTSNSK
jgi:hypothetical protein